MTLALALALALALDHLSVYWRQYMLSAPPATTKMVVKTQLCMFTETKIYPGRGMIQVRRDGQPLWLSGSKARGLYNGRKRPAKLTWTQAWRRLHKKDQARSNLAKKKTRKRTAFARSVVGADAAEIRKRKGQSKDVRSAAREMALREIKERKKAAKTARAKAQGGGAKAGKGSGKAKR